MGKLKEEKMNRRQGGFRGWRDLFKGERERKKITVLHD